MKQREWFFLAVAALAGVWCPPGLPTAFAGLVKPGQTLAVQATDFEVPDGEVLAEAVLPFSIDYDVEGAGRLVDFDGTVNGTLTSTVLRDEGDGTLLFVYDVDLAADLDDADASDASILTVGGFDNFRTDVDGALDFESVVLASRSTNGDAVRLASDDAGLGGPPRLIVRTDATDFAPTGTARFLAGDELAVRTGDGIAVGFASGTAVVGGTFQPVVDNGDQTPPPTPIPLPPAAWSALAALGTLGLLRKVRACCTLRFPPLTRGKGQG